METVRFYQRKELLREPKTKLGFRTYNIEDAQKIIFIKKAQELGFSLAEVKELLDLNLKPRQTCGTVQRKTIDKIKEIDQKIIDLEKMKAGLIKICEACDSSQDDLKQYKVQECFALGQETEEKL